MNNHDNCDDYLTWACGQEVECPTHRVATAATKMCGKYWEGLPIVELMQLSLWQKWTTYEAFNSIGISSNSWRALTCCLPDIHDEGSEMSKGVRACSTLYTKWTGELVCTYPLRLSYAGRASIHASGRHMLGQKISKKAEGIDVPWMQQISC